jgi:hypothetical protein
MVEGLDHVQLAMPRGGEEWSRAYFAGLLGLAEGGCAVGWDGELAARRRFYGEDPFGTRWSLSGLRVGRGI